MRYAGTEGDMKRVIYLLCILLLAAAPLSAGDANLLEEINDYLKGPEMYSILSDTHTVVGYTSAALGLAACVFNPGLVEDDLHGALGTAAAVTSAVNIGVGLLNYGDRIFSGESSDGWLSADTIHAAMGITGSVLMIVAAASEDSDAHPWLGGIGAGLMSASIIIELL